MSIYSYILFTRLGGATELYTCASMQSEVGAKWIGSTCRAECIQANVRGEPVFSVMAANWFCEKAG
jgi:hypothetical protein